MPNPTHAQTRPKSNARPNSSKPKIKNNSYRPIYPHNLVQNTATEQNAHDASQMRHNDVTMKKTHDFSNELLSPNTSANKSSTWTSNRFRKHCPLAMLASNRLHKCCPLAMLGNTPVSCGLHAGGAPMDAASTSTLQPGAPNIPDERPMLAMLAYACRMPLVQVPTLLHRRRLLI